jgi:hypothetical protein
MELESDQGPYLFLRTLAIICCPRGDISVELAGDAGISVPPAEYHSSTARDLFGVFGARPSERNISKGRPGPVTSLLTDAPVILLGFICGQRFTMGRYWRSPVGDVVAKASRRIRGRH